jgi:hypothetical protein
VEDCYTDDYYLLRVLEVSSHALQRLTLHNVRLRKRTWMSLFAESATNISLRVLSSCKVGNLWDEVHGYWLEGGDKTIEASTRAQVSTALSNLAAGLRTFTLDG